MLSMRIAGQCSRRADRVHHALLCSDLRRSLPNGTVLIPDGGVIIIPPGTGNSSSPPTPPNNTNWWSTNQTVDVPGVVVTTPSDNGTIVVVVRPPNVTEGHGGSPSLPGGAPRGERLHGCMLWLTHAASCLAAILLTCGCAALLLAPRAASPQTRAATSCHPSHR